MWAIALSTQLSGDIPLAVILVVVQVAHDFCQLINNNRNLWPLATCEYESRIEKWNKNKSKAKATGATHTRTLEQSLIPPNDNGLMLMLMLMLRLMMMTKCQTTG